MARRQLIIDGRELTVYDEGDPAGAAILVHHGTPAAGPPFAGWVQDASARGARLIGYDRPGYGASVAASGRTVGDVAVDATSIMDALDVELDEGAWHDTEETQEGFLIDFDSDHRIVALEFLGASKLFPEAALARLNHAA